MNSINIGLREYCIRFFIELPLNNEFEFNTIDGMCYLNEERVLPIKVRFNTNSEFNLAMEICSKGMGLLLISKTKPLFDNKVINVRMAEFNNEGKFVITCSKQKDQIINGEPNILIKLSINKELYLVEEDEYVPLVNLPSVFTLNSNNKPSNKDFSKSKGNNTLWSDW